MISTIPGTAVHGATIDAPDTVDDLTARIVDGVRVVIGAAASNIFTSVDHDFFVGESVTFQDLDGGGGLSNGAVYFVTTSNHTINTFSVSLVSGGAVLDITTDLTFGFVRKVYPNLVTVEKRLDEDGDPLGPLASFIAPSILPARLEWLDDGEVVGFEDIDITPESILITDPAWAPTVADVAALLHSRTKNRGGLYLGTFTDQTNPTDVRVAHLVNIAQDHVISDIGGNPSEISAQRNARVMTIIYTAMLIELGHYSEQITRDISPYKELKKLYDSMLEQLEDETGPDTGHGAVDSLGNPNYHFDGIAVGYKAW